MQMFDEGNISLIFNIYKIKIIYKECESKI